MPARSAAVASRLMLDLVVPDHQIPVAGELADSLDHRRVIHQFFEDGRRLPDIDNLVHRAFSLRMLT